MYRIRNFFFPLVFSLSLLCPTRAENGIKNVILMIPDGCSTEMLALGRWMNRGLPLALDRHIRGLVRTYCSDSPIGDSAPTGSTYATGHRSRDGFVATYPDRSMDKTGERFRTDSSQAFRPMFTLMEAAKNRGMATGIVVTCYFPHATPADFLAHNPDRNQYHRIAKQMVFNPCDVLLGGGSFFIDSSQTQAGYRAEEVLRQQNIFYTRDFSRVQDTARKGQNRIWGLFAPLELDYEIDRKPEEQPSIEEMTRQAIEMLSRQENGFFLMVEGSKIDWGAHNNDLPAALFDFLAFDRAVGIAMDFAQKDGQTLVVVLPDHQTGGPTIGNIRSNSTYAKLSAHELFDPIGRYTSSAEKAVQELVTRIPANANDSVWTAALQETLEQKFGLTDIPEAEIDTVLRDIRKYGKRSKSIRALCHLLNRHTYIGWTTHGHHGGDVFLAIFHPENRILQGVVDNEDIAPYICREAGLGDLDSLSAVFYRPIREVFPHAEIRIHSDPDSKSPDPLFAELKLPGKRKLKIFPNTNYLESDGKRIRLPGICIYNDKDFYLPTQTALLPELKK